jgi:hypothetical protein
MKAENQFGRSYALCAAILFAIPILVVMSAGSALASGAREKVIYSFQGGSDG